MSARKAKGRAGYFVGKNIRRRREELGFKTLMDFWGGLGIEISLASMYEKQTRRVPVELLPEISTRLGSTIDDLFHDPALMKTGVREEGRPYRHAATIPILGIIGPGDRVQSFTKPRDLMIFDRDLVGPDESLPDGSPRWGAYIVEGADFDKWGIADKDLIIADHKPAESIGTIVIVEVEGRSMFLQNHGEAKSAGSIRGERVMWFSSGRSGAEPVLAASDRVKVIGRLHCSVRSH